MAEADLKQKVKVRGGHKGYVTKALTKCKEALSGSIDPALIKKLKEWKINLNAVTKWPAAGQYSEKTK